MQNERIKTEEHIEYDSDDLPNDGSSSSSSKSSHHKLEPEIYKTRKDENYTEYFKIGKDNNNKVNETAQCPINVSIIIISAANHQSRRWTSLCV